MPLVRVYLLTGDMRTDGQTTPKHNASSAIYQIGGGINISFCCITKNAIFQQTK